MTILSKYSSKGLIYQLTMKSLLILFISCTVSIYGSIQHPASSQKMKDYLLAKEIYSVADSAYDKCLAICLHCYQDPQSFYHCANVQCPSLQNANFPPHFDEDCVFLSSSNMQLKESLVN
ncbi:unnamed protein product [Schistosoma turkestanicum]|nr:unnamed protein product [Schistosoma turkestanicum]